MPTVTIPATVVEAAAAKLEEKIAAGPTTYTVRSAIAQILPQVRRMVGSGWSYDTIATALTEVGIPVKASTLRGYLAEIEKDAAATGEVAVPAKPAAKAGSRRATKAARPAGAPAPTSAPVPPPMHAGFDEDA